MSNKMIRNCIFSSLFISVFFLSNPLPAEDLELFSPDKSIQIMISIADKITYSVFLDGKILISPSNIALNLKEIGILGAYPKVKKTDTRSVDEILYPVVAVKSKQVEDRYNELSISFDQPFKVDFRAYDYGVAYRFQTGFPGRIKVENEEVALCFSGDHKVYFPTEESFLTHSERLYEYLPLSSIPADKMASLPVLVDIEGGPKLAITETGLEDYPG
ncbi:MAG: glycoside hydrolase family 97 N-terminal domain-containing protein, partial [Candidatus Aminicenantes bacterium]|nr:glycoside hydrolase family 97 N-terminal domain-containing protein [Candidatus Aminicenantes bacterium]